MSVSSVCWSFCATVRVYSRTQCVLVRIWSFIVFCKACINFNVQKGCNDSLYDVRTKKGSPLADVGDFYEAVQLMALPEGHLWHETEWNFPFSPTCYSLHSVSSSSCDTFLFPADFLGSVFLTLRPPTFSRVFPSSAAARRGYLFSRVALFVLSPLCILTKNFILYYAFLNRLCFL